MADIKKKAEDILEDYSNSYSQVDLETLAKFLDQIKTEAYRELVDKYKNEVTKRYEDIAYKDLYFGVIDTTLKELTEKNDFKSKK